MVPRRRKVTAGEAAELASTWRASQLALRVSIDDGTIEVPDDFTADTQARVLPVVRGR
ncbi:hypothetical protein L6R53_02945 [Myxococcota bacterium]|nr:hypothetical protein [Myxococcota bacterium]